MFFGLIAIDDHPCCKMQDLVEAFFLASVNGDIYAIDLFPDWTRATLNKKSCSLFSDFEIVHKLLHAEGMDATRRKAIHDEVTSINKIQSLCDGTEPVPITTIDWESPLGKAIETLMEKLYDSLDLAVFKRKGKSEKPTHQLYCEFISENKYVCPFCGLDKFKNRRGKRRQDFDHYFHQSGYPLAAANMRNLIPTCGTCNQDYKKAQNILSDGAAFYPYAVIPPVQLEIGCEEYPATDDFDDGGRWSVKLELATPDPAVAPKMTAWNRVYSVKQRLENEVREFCEEWMTEITDDLSTKVDETKFAELIASAKVKAKEQSLRRMQPGQIVKAAFYDFILTKADKAFIESFRRLQNERCS
jgi:hypothetical protein